MESAHFVAHFFAKPAVAGERLWPIARAMGKPGLQKKSAPEGAKETSRALMQFSAALPGLISPELLVAPLLAAVQKFPNMFG